MTLPAEMAPRSASSVAATSAMVSNIPTSVASSRAFVGAVASSRRTVAGASAALGRSGLSAGAAQERARAGPGVLPLSKVVWPDLMVAT